MEVLEAAPPGWEDSYPLNNNLPLLCRQDIHAAAWLAGRAGTAATPRPDNKTCNPFLDKHASSHSPQRPG